MRLIVSGALIFVALIHLPPLVGVLGGARLGKLYGISVQDPNLDILLRHRALLFGLLAAFLGYAAFQPHLHLPAIVAGGVSVFGYLALARRVGGYNQALARVYRADLLAGLGIVVAGVAHLL